jgi:hypothetical protein
MHASQAYLDAAGATRPTRIKPQGPDDFALLNILLAGPGENPPSLDRSKSKDQRQAEEENEQPTISKPGGFRNDPDDPKNPCEVRERHLKKINR